MLTSVLILARFQQCPNAYCHSAVKRVLRYLKGSSNFSLKYTAGSSDLSVLVDSDYAGDTEDRKSMSGFIVKIGEAVVNWGSKKQTSVSLSTCEAEYFAMSIACQEVVWMRKVLSEFGVLSEGRTKLLSDNSSAISWASGGNISPKRAKHIDVRVHFIKDLVANKFVQVGYVPSEENDADLMTKPLETLLLQRILRRISLSSAVEEEY